MEEKNTLYIFKCVHAFFKNRQLRKAEHALKQQTEGGHSFAVRTLWLAFTFPPLNVLGWRLHLWGMGWCWVKVKAGHILASGWEVRVRLSPRLEIESQSGRQAEKNVFVAPARSHDRSGSQWRNVPCSPPDSLHCPSQVSYMSRGREHDHTVSTWFPQTTLPSESGLFQPGGMKLAAACRLFPFLYEHASDDCNLFNHDDFVLVE